MKPIAHARDDGGELCKSRELSCVGRPTAPAAILPSEEQRRNRAYEVLESCPQRSREEHAGAVLAAAATLELEADDVQQRARLLAYDVVRVAVDVLANRRSDETPIESLALLSTLLVHGPSDTTYNEASMIRTVAELVESALQPAKRISPAVLGQVALYNGPLLYAGIHARFHDRFEDLTEHQCCEAINRWYADRQPGTEGKRKTTGIVADLLGYDRLICSQTPEIENRRTKVSQATDRGRGRRERPARARRNSAKTGAK